jgi:hypothetical protein
MPLGLVYYRGRRVLLRVRSCHCASTTPRSRYSQPGRALRSQAVLPCPCVHVPLPAVGARPSRRLDELAELGQRI